jgi:hypothetical protein
MNRMAKPATVPVVLPISFEAMVARLCLYALQKQKYNHIMYSASQYTAYQDP